MSMATDPTKFQHIALSMDRLIAWRATRPTEDVTRPIILTPAQAACVWTSTGKHEYRGLRLEVA